MTGMLNRFLVDEDGATAIEYGLIAALMGIGVISAFTLFGNSLVGLFEYIRDSALDVMSE